MPSIYRFAQCTRCCLVVSGRLEHGFAHAKTHDISSSYSEVTLVSLCNGNVENNSNSAGNPLCPMPQRLWKLLNPKLVVTTS